MKLKNKKTGEIVDFKIHKYAELSDDGNPVYAPFNGSIEEWEDAPEEPKGIQCVYYVNHFDAAKIDGVIVGFGTKEEAEKAVEKLKAVKRLKDKGLKFDLDFVMNRIDFTYNRSKTISEELELSSQIFNDMKLLFGGEE